MGRNTRQQSRKGLSINITKYKKTGKGHSLILWCFFFPLEKRRRSKNRKKLRRRQRFQLVDQRTTRGPKVEERLPSSHWREDRRCVETETRSPGSGPQTAFKNQDVLFCIWHDLILRSVFFISSEQVEENQREVQRPGRGGQRADDAAAGGEDERRRRSGSAEK